MRLGELSRLPIAMLRFLLGLGFGGRSRPPVVGGMRRFAATGGLNVFYVGRREGREGVVYLLEDHRASPEPTVTVLSTGIDWGRSDERALGLAYLLLTDFTGDVPDEDQARRFSAAVIEKLDLEGFVLAGEEIARWLQGLAPAPRR
jgi:hypothetical protein